MKPIAVVIEHDLIHREAWVEKLSEEFHQVLALDHPWDFFDYFEDHENTIANVALVIVDKISHKYDSVEQQFGIDSRNKFPNFKGKMVVSSGVYDFPELISGFDLAVPKQPLSFKEIQNLISSLR